MTWFGFFFFILPRSLSKICLADTEIRFCSFSVNIYKVTGQFPWSSLRETDRGISTEFGVRLLLLFSYLEWQVLWFSCHHVIMLNFDGVLFVSFLSGRRTTRWSGRECGGSSAVWHALPLLLSERKAVTRSNPPFPYVCTTIKTWSD